MGRSKRHELPTMQCMVKGSGEYARARYAGREFFLGKWGTPEARAAHDALLPRILNGGVTAAVQTQPASLPMGQPVAVIGGEREKYGRTLVRVEVEGIDLGHQLVADGLAWHYAQFSNDARLARDAITDREESQAQRSRRPDSR